jgi:aerobic C4-dicarboxylate transport protein
VFAAFTSGDVLQVLLFSIIFGCALSLVGERGEPILQLVERGGVVLFRAMTFIVRLAPLGVLGAIAFTVGKYGIGSLKQLGYLVGLFYVTVGIFVVLVLGTVAGAGRRRRVGHGDFKEAVAVHSTSN